MTVAKCGALHEHDRHPYEVDGMIEMCDGKLHSIPESKR